MTGTITSPGLWMWGNNNYGQLGQNNIVHRSSPVQVGSLTNWKSIGLSNTHSMAIKTDGTLWTWGFNGFGELGQNVAISISRSSPVQVGSLSNWKQIDGDYGNAIAVKTDGTLWAWGRGSNGVLGLNQTNVNRSSPVQVGSLTNWKQVSMGTDHCVAVKLDGTLWAWGSGAFGQLGTGNTTARSSPIQVGTLTNWKQASAGNQFGGAVKVDGTLWLMGGSEYDNIGQIGQRNILLYSSPTQVGTLNDWKLISCGGLQAAAIKTNGTLWVWGGNSFGQLGLNDLVHRSSPVQVGSLTNWKTVNVGQYNMTAIKTDGTLWAWGGNELGQLGQNNIVHRSSPVQVGSLTNWKQVAVTTNGLRGVTMAISDGSY